MKISGLKIAEYLRKILSKEVGKLGKKHPTKLVVFLAKETPDQLSFVKIKSQLAKKLKIGFELINFKTTPLFQKIRIFTKR